MRKRLLSVILVFIVIFASITFSVSAAEPTISASASAGSVTVGKTVNVVIKFNHPDTKLIGAEATVEFSSNFEFSSAATNVGDIDFNKISNTKAKILLDLDSAQKNLTITLKFKAKASGTGSFKVTATGETEDSDKTTTTTLSVKAVDQTTLPGNAKASKITPSAGKLVPDFSPDVTNYTIDVDYSVTEVLLSVSAEDPKAGIEVEGSKNMKVGKNTRTVVITAQNGDFKKYVITINRAAAEGDDVPSEPDTPVVEPTVDPYKIEVDGETRYMVKSYDDLSIPSGFSVGTYTIGENEVVVLKDVLSSKIVVYATDELGQNGIYFLYNPLDKTFSPYRYMEGNNVNLIIIDYTGTVPTLKNYFYTTISVEGHTVSGFKYNDNTMSDFVIFYGETDKGEKTFYRYDQKDGTIQRAVEFILEMQNSEQNLDSDDKNVIGRFMDLNTKSKVIVISGAAFIIVLIILIIVAIVRLARRTPSAESLEAAREQEFMEGFGKNDHLYISDDDSVIDSNFRLKDNDD